MAAEGRIRFIFEALDRTAGVIRTMQNRMMGLTAVQRRIPPLLVPQIERGWAVSADFFAQFDQYTRGFRTSVRDRLQIPLQRLPPVMSEVGTALTSLDRRMGRVAWTFTWGALSMMGVMWNFQWLLSIFIEPLKNVFAKLMDFADAAFSVATWLGYASAMGFDFADKLGGIGEAVGKVIDAGLFLQATLGGIAATFIILMAEALKQPGVMDAITRAMEAWISVITDPQIITALADIVRGMAHIAAVVIPMIPPLIPIIEEFLSSLLDLVPGTTAAMSGFEKLGVTLGLIQVAFFALQPVMLPLMLLLSSLTATIVGSIIVAKLFGTVLKFLAGDFKILSSATRAAINVKRVLIGIFTGLRFAVLAAAGGIRVFTLALMAGNPLAWALLVVLGLLFVWLYRVTDGFRNWGAIITTVRGYISTLVGWLRQLWDWLMRILEPLRTVVGLAGGVAGFIGAGVTTVYQTVSIGTIRETAETDEVLRRLATESTTTIRGGY